MFVDDKHQENLEKEENLRLKEEKKEKIIMKERRPQNSVLVGILILLILQLLMSGFQTYQNVVKEIQRSQLITNVTKYTANADQLTTQMLSDYKTDVYNNANVNSTEKQQVMGTEYNFMAMMLLAKQNSRLMELLAQIQ